MTPGTHELEGRLFSRHVGFTGTRLGMTGAQIEQVDQLLLDDMMTDCAHHGDCIGADDQFHNLAKLNNLKTHGHPPLNLSKRAFCEFDTSEEEKEYLDRDRDIVDAVDWMIACPGGFKEELKSGTWYTIRYARKVNRPGWIVWPDGKVTGIYEDYK